MESQPQQIKGYRDLSQNEIDLMNDAKTKAENIGELIGVLKDQKLADPRWLAIAQTTLQQGFMFLVRSIAKPESF